MSGKAREAGTLPLAGALERLSSPDACEAFSPLTGEPLLAVDLDAGQALPAASALAAAGATLAQLPCPSVALGKGPSTPEADAFRARFDVVLESAEELASLRSRVTRCPLASMALVQLLRFGEGLGVEAGLFAESLVYATLQAGPEFAAWLARRKTPPPRPPNPEPAVRVTRELDRLQLRLNRPEKRNAFSAEMRDALCEALGLALWDDSIREIVLSGEGHAFCSGGDLDEFGTRPDPATAHAIRSTRNAARLLAACAPRVRAELHGACVGAGAELPAFAGRVVARADTCFELPELTLGLVPGAGGTVSLPRRIGRQRTAWLALSGARIDAQTALRWGLVDELRPQTQES